MNSDKIGRITVWWQPKAGAIISLLLFYLALWTVPFYDGWKLLLFSFITLTGFGLTGYFLNDWADIPFDRGVGKTNLVDGVSKPLRPMILAGLVAIALFPWFVYFSCDFLSVGLICLQLLLQLAYPLPPIRLKNKPVLAIITDSLYAFVIPVILAWYTFDLTLHINDNKEQFVHFVFLSLWMFSMGVRHIINHHVNDVENDRSTGTANLALIIPTIRIRKLFQSYLYPIELVSAILFFASLLQFSSLIPLVFVLIAILVGASSVQGQGSFFLVPFSKIKMDEFASFQLGIISSIFLMLQDLSYVWILILFLSLFSNRFQLVFRGVFSWGKTAFWKTPLNQASLGFNWGIYYFRKWLLNWPEDRNWGEHYPKRLLDLEDKRRAKNGVVGVFNQNHSKYSETFISGQNSALNYRVSYYSGWPKPLHLDGHGYLVKPDSVNAKIKYAMMSLFHENIRTYEDNRIAESLIQNNVSVIIAHFGPMGTALMDVASITGIPMIAVFHGYDAWNNKELQQYESKYLELFKCVVQVIGVSRDICKQLKKLGCPEEKIEYLPAFVDPIYFTSQIQYGTDPTFLSVGRFSCTKSPFLVILAFREVLHEVSNAKLKMIGGDDGEGLYEACQILVKSLNLEDNVEFLGVVPPSRVLEEMSNTTVFVQHSVTTPIQGDKEGTPVSIMEAMALGLPIVATDHAGIGELIDNGKTGILVREYDYEKMGQEMLRLARNKDLRAELGKNAAKAIRENEFVVKGLEKFSEIIDRHKQV